MDVKVKLNKAYAGQSKGDIITVSLRIANRLEKKGIGSIEKESQKAISDLKATNKKWFESRKSGRSNYEKAVAEAEKEAKKKMKAEEKAEAKRLEEEAKMKAELEAAELEIRSKYK